jgi:hypothetical protein
VHREAVVDYVEQPSPVLVKASSVFSRCDLAEHSSNATDYEEDAYGFAGVENLSITPCAGCDPVNLSVLAGRMEALGTPNGSVERHRCAYAGVETGGTGAETCGTFATDALQLGGANNLVDVDYGYAPAPTHNADGSWTYARSAFHLTVTDLGSGRSVTVDAGLIALTVYGGKAAPPVAAPLCPAAKVARYCA